MSLDISIPDIDFSIESINKGATLSVSVFDTDANETALINLSQEQALRLASILTTWAESGELPEGEERWE